MSTVRLLLALLLSLPSAASAAPVGCEASATTRSLLEQLAKPDYVRQPAAQRTAQNIILLRTALSYAPRDMFLHEAYQDLAIGRIGDRRAVVIEEYQTLLTRHPADPVFLYLAARARYSWQTKQSIAELGQALATAPDFAPAHLLLA